MKKGSLLIIIPIIILIFAALSVIGDDESSPSQTYGYRVVNVYPHDSSAFTEGLVYNGSMLYEGTGLNGKSSLRQVDLETGIVQNQILIPAEFFGEGITIWKDRLIQLTWKSKVGFIYDKESLALIGNFSYQTEGWGITTDGSQLIMSDGSSTLYFLDPDTFRVTGMITVRDGGREVEGLNELEYINGMIYANIWPTDMIAIISPETGDVQAWIDLTGLLSEEKRMRTDVLNGIAYDREGDKLFVTGKLWPSLFEIKLVAKDK